MCRALTPKNDAQGLGIRGYLADASSYFADRVGRGWRRVMVCDADSGLIEIHKQFQNEPDEF